MCSPLGVKLGMCGNLGVRVRGTVPDLSRRFNSMGSVSVHPTCGRGRKFKCARPTISGVLGSAQTSKPAGTEPRLSEPW